MNPIRFRNTDSDPDWITAFPNYVNITQREENFTGMYPSDFFKDHITNRAIIVQFQTTTSYERIVNVYKYNQSLETYEFYEALSGTDITPSGWTSGDIYKYSFTPTVSGVYKMIYTDADVESDEFVVHSDTTLKKQLVEVSFYNTENDYGMVFYDGVTNNYTGLVFFTGVFQNFDPANETSAYTNDRGGTEILKSSPVHGGTLNLEMIHHSYIDNINLIFSCDRLTVNGIEYGRSEAPTFEQIEKSDLVNVKIKLIKRENSYYAEA